MILKRKLVAPLLSAIFGITAHAGGSERPENPRPSEALAVPVSAAAEIFSPQSPNRFPFVATTLFESFNSEHYEKSVMPGAYYQGMWPAADGSDPILLIPKLVAQNPDAPTHEAGFLIRNQKIDGFYAARNVMITSLNDGRGNFIISGDLDDATVQEMRLGALRAGAIVSQCLQSLVANGTPRLIHQYNDAITATFDEGKRRDPFNPKFGKGKKPKILPEDSEFVPPDIFLVVPPVSVSQEEGNDYVTVYPSAHYNPQDLPKEYSQYPVAVSEIQISGKKFKARGTSTVGNSQAVAFVAMQTAISVSQFIPDDKIGPDARSVEISIMQSYPKTLGEFVQYHINNVQGTYDPDLMRHTNSYSLFYFSPNEPVIAANPQPTTP
jgi:hypothetical protein